MQYSFYFPGKEEKPMKKSNMKKILAVMLTGAMAVGMLAGCGSSSKASSASGDGSAKKLNLMMWDGDCSEEVVKDFEKKYGVDVNITYIEDTNEMLSKMINSKQDYDVIDLESAYVKAFEDAGLLEKLDKDSMDNLKYVDQDTFMAKGSGPIGDEDFTYTIPISGPLYTCIVYNKKTCPKKITSFADLADPAFKGQICSVNATISLYAEALRACGYPIGSTDDKELAKAQELLKKFKKNVKSFVGSSALSQLESGECSVALCWDYNYLCADSEKYWDEFDIVPVTGLGYTQNWAIAKSSTRKDLATEFINFTYQPEEQAKSLNEYGGVPIIKKADIADKLADNYYDNPCVTKYTEMWKDNEMLCSTDEQISKMDDLYNELMSE